MSGLLAVGVLAALAAGAMHYVTYVPPFQPPSRPMPDPNGYDAAMATLARLPDPPGDEAGRRRAITEAEPLLDELHRALRMEWRVPPAFGPYEERKQRLLLLFLGARHLLLAGLDTNSGHDPQQSLRHGLDAMALAAKLTHGGDCEILGVASNCHRMGRSVTSQVVDNQPLPDVLSALDRVQQIRADWRPYSETLEAQRLLLLARTTHSLRTARKPSVSDLVPEWGDLLEADGRAYAFRQLKRTLRPRESILAEVDRYSLRCIEEARRPRHLREPVPLPEEAPHLLDSESYTLLPFRPYNPADERARETALTDLTMLQLALAARAHHLTFGRYPSRLDQIDRKWLPNSLLDLWGRPIVYRLRAGRPLIYSLDGDGVDDGGTPYSPERSAWDWVWGAGGIPSYRR